MMVRWMCDVSLKNRKRSEVMYSLLGVQIMAEVVRHGRLRWFGHVERKSGDDWVSACRNVVVVGVRCVGRDRKTWRECVKDDTDELGLHPEWAVFRDTWRGLRSGKTLLKVFLINLTLIIIIILIIIKGQLAIMPVMLQYKFNSYNSKGDICNLNLY